MRLAVIVDNMKVARWQAECLRDLKGCTEIFVYNCTNTPSGRRQVSHALYYVLNLLAVRNRYTRSVPLPDLPRIPSSTTDFQSEADGIWQRLPQALLTRIAKDKPDAILKFGMTLLRVPDAATLPSPILSFHHGDPDHFRGRPAGFYEVLQDKPVMGQIVQILSNRLDGGRVVAFAETKVHRHSYRATLEDAFRHSRLLINTALANAVGGTGIVKHSNGPVYRLPKNGTVGGFFGRLLTRSLSRLFYGAFVEKAWQVSLAKADRSGAGAEPWTLPGPDEWQTINVPAGYSFIADPFFDPAGDGVIVEALNARTGRGELVHIAGDSVRPLTKPGSHYSYPGGFDDGHSHFILPETAQWSPARLYEWKAGRLEDAGELDVEGRPRLLDPTLYSHKGHLFLFGNVASEGQYVLRLWHAPSLNARFTEHPSSPIHISPSGGRMGGAVLAKGARIFRLGQNFERSYGDGLFVYEIEELNPQRYREVEVGAVAFEGVSGPHTLNLRDGRAVFDWYRDEFSILAGVRRLRGRYG